MISPTSYDEWPVAPKRLHLAPDEVQVWQISLDGSAARVHAFTQTLAADERKRADDFRFAEHRRRFIIGRGTLRALLGQYLDRAPADLKFVYGPYGKPSLFRGS